MLAKGNVAMSANSESRGPVGRSAVLTGMSLAAVAAWSSSAAAQQTGTATFESDAWEAEIDVRDGFGDFGLSSWSSKGTATRNAGPDHVNRASYYLDVAVAGGEFRGPETLGFTPLFQTNFGQGGDASRAFVDYSYDGGDGYGGDEDLLFDLRVEYQITGRTPLASTITETVLLFPRGNGAFDAQLYAYADYDLDGTPGGDVGQRTGNPSFRQLTQAGTFVDTTAFDGTTSPRSIPEAFWLYNIDPTDNRASVYDQLSRREVPAGPDTPVNGQVNTAPGDVEHAFRFNPVSFSQQDRDFAVVLAEVERKGIFADVVFPVDDDDPDDTQFTFEDDSPPEKGQPPRFYDPVVAVGYDYAVAAGEDNLFGELILPGGFTDGQYLLTITDPDHPRFGESIPVVGDYEIVSFDFGDGAASFRVEGIEVEAMVDPTDELGFPTGLTFMNGNAVTFTQTAIVVPEPATVGLLAAGGVLLMRRRR